MRYAVWIVGTAIGLGALGFDLENLAFLAGTVGVGIGFGLQNIFANFVSGMIVLLEGTLKVRDFVELESGVRGTVREIGLRFTRIETNDGVDVLVPNSEFVNRRVTNWTFEERIRRLRVRFGVPAGTDKAAVREIVTHVASHFRGAVPGRGAEVRMVGFGDGRLDFELIVWIGSTWVDQPGLAHAEVLWALDDALRAAGIAVPVAQLEVVVQGNEAIRAP